MRVAAPAPKLILMLRLAPMEEAALMVAEAVAAADCIHLSKACLTVYLNRKPIGPKRGVPSGSRQQRTSLTLCTRVTLTSVCARPLKNRDTGTARFPCPLGEDGSLACLQPGSPKAPPR